MAKKLTFSKIDLIERVGALMLVAFLDEQGNLYQWAPKWKDVEQIFLKQINVERFNKPGSEWLNKFARTAQDVVENAQRIESAHKIFGTFTQYYQESLVIDRDKNKSEVLTPGFDVTLQFLDNWLGTYVEVFLINDIAIRLRQQFQDESGEGHIIDYPPNIDE